MWVADAMMIMLDLCSNKKDPVSTRLMCPGVLLQSMGLYIPLMKEVEERFRKTSAVPEKLGDRRIR